ncbi:tRNA (adenosine(37)-N6)-threonylcarbamoyltransferase complex dimerization subunit type 1 TsaB [Entomospira entomophila]|uniref:tRNA (Adenosine(37)-N6)-threonylcarbamoyltransferase complex dimerization subunit type 1 TsaB n=1 Tax=Entomospira entomophila TaxID=2719988 RepID=A0A968KR80_9SPIO|nr:tRNA (adenosine(37)-N6)-threonylcarbamoyltransferase complex dimerization subunit type 1 TsaB [Entomospira entomophilus]NIZ40453.1 tRNA (adenosine(37)-N6)-threonylcarbamoyltransferase complex dimerization subunit type 1 TsaB [Entomospira entomophilus]WDI36011.1 tRNA (adenosine(37)-N6)-threonylcarbamoyltransferase complex dimerization subunit type 1 TsaB [Entomospira entomophilus]
MVSIDKTILAIDTAGPYLGVALMHKKKLYQHHWQGDSKQQEALTTSVQMLLLQAQIEPNALDLIAVMKGPGTFTGLRVGMAAGKGLSYALQIPQVSVPTLMAFSASLSHKEYSASILDARKGRYYAQLFHWDQPITPEMDSTAQEIILKMIATGNNYWHVTGYGVEAFIESVPETSLTFSFLANAHRSKAENLLAVAWKYYQEHGADTLNSGPSYLRLSEAELSVRGSSS